METIRQYTDPMIDRLGEYLPTAIVALVVFVVGWLFAAIVSAAVGQILRVTHIDSSIEKTTGEPYRAASFISRIIRYILLICVVLLVLDILGIEGALNPLWNMFNKIVAMLPNIVAALLIGYIGYILADMASAAVKLITKRTDGIINEKLGLGETFQISEVLKKITFITVFVILLIAALEALRIEAISDPAIQMLKTLFQVIPTLIYAALILTVAYFVGRFASNSLTAILKNLNADSIPNKLGLQALLGEGISLSQVCGKLVFFFFMLGATISATEHIQMKILSEMLMSLLRFGGQIALGLIILAIGNFFANFVYRMMSKSGERKFLAQLTRIVIIGIVIAMGLEAMGVADNIVNLAFGLSLGACAVAAALSFGLGGREAAGEQLDYWFKKLRDKG